LELKSHSRSILYLLPVTSGDPSRDYFQGAAVFLHTDGTGKDHFAQHVHRLAVVQSLLAAGP
jgi:hypothetical protein